MTQESNQDNTHTPGNDTPRVLEELSKKNQAPHTQRSRVKNSGLRRFLIPIAILVPVVLALFYLSAQQTRTSVQLAALLEENSALRASVASVADVSNVAPVLPANLADTRMLDELQTRLGSRIDALTRSAAAVQERLAGMSQPQQDAELVWTEAEYLLRLANQKIQLEGDGDSALMILMSVDEMLRDSGEVSLLGVRDMLAGEILALRSMEHVDITGLYVRIDNLLPVIAQLSMRSAIAENYNAQLAQQREQSMDSNAGFIAQAMALLRSIFVWQRWDENPEALLPPQQEAMLKQNLRLMLEQAQLGLLMEQPEVFRSSLSKATEWVERYFAIDTASGRILREDLAALAALEIRQPRPDISASLDLLRQISADRNRITDGR